MSKPERSNGLPSQLRTGIEALSGMDMGNVVVHRNSSKPAQLNALAYAQGNEIHLGAGQDKHLPHEAWHVVQQRQGRVKATTQMQSVPVNDDRSLEREADVMGASASAWAGSPAQMRASASQPDEPAQSMPGVLMMKKDAALAELTAKEDGWTATKVIKPKNGKKGIFRFPMDGDNIDTFIGKNNVPSTVDVPSEHSDAENPGKLHVSVADHDLSKTYGDKVDGLSDNQIVNGARGSHFSHGDKAHGNPTRTNSLTWHHKGTKGHMELIDMNVHGAFWHYGGIANWEPSKHGTSADDDDAGGTS
ncbi:eCIS core domain-containing protein [Dyella flagellata]|uniref:eCIS core domain-containing protein n=1 Tax=Dyella flagellata TaxID=1867833 RepID=UPI00384E5257